MDSLRANVYYSLIILTVVNSISSYKPMDYYDNDTELRKAINQIRDNHFSPTEPGTFQDIVNSLLHHDR